MMQNRERLLRKAGAGVLPMLMLLVMSVCQAAVATAEAFKLTAGNASVSATAAFLEQRGAPPNGERRDMHPRLTSERMGELFVEILGKTLGSEVALSEGKGGSVVLAVAEDFPELAARFGIDPNSILSREDYVIHTDGERIILLGATSVGTQMAAADLLHRWGYRQFFPWPAWEIIPDAQALTLDESVRGNPAYLFRDIFSVNYMPDEQIDYQRWRWINRMGGGFQLSTRHVYQDIVRRHRGVFARNDDYFAMVNGKRQVFPNKRFKFNPLNKELLDLLVEDANARFSIDNVPDSLSMEPSDLGGWDNSPEVLETVGGASNQAITLANVVAREAAAPRGKYVGLYAYYEHQMPPTIRVEPNIIVSFATRFLRPGRDIYQSIQDWRDQGLELVGVRDYHSYWDWDLAMPGRALGGDVAYLTNSIRKFYALGARFYTSESESAWPAYGLGYYLTSQLLWDPSLDAQAITDDFITRAFAPCAEPMRELFSLLNGEGSVMARQTQVSTYYELLLRALDEAGSDEGVKLRLLDMFAYVRYIELLSNVETARLEDKAAAMSELSGWVFRSEPLHILPVRKFKRAFRYVFSGYGRLSDQEFTALEEAAKANPITLDEVAGYARSSLESGSGAFVGEMKLLDIAAGKPLLRSPWLRFGTCLIFPMEADQEVEVRLTMRRFGYSEPVNYVVTGPDGEIAQRGQINDEGHTLTLKSSTGGYYQLITEYTPNLIRCESSRVFYIKPSVDFNNIEMVTFTGDFNLRLPAGVEQIVVGGQGQGEKVGVRVLRSTGAAIAAEGAASGVDLFVQDLESSTTQGGYRVQFAKPSSGRFEDMFFKFNSKASFPVSLIPDAIHD